MTTFDRREEAFENLFVHDEELHFRAEARRAKAVAAWVAERTGKTDADTTAYVDEIVAFTTLNGGDEPLFQRLRTDLGGAVGDAELRARLARELADALAYLKTA